MNNTAWNPSLPLFSYRKNTRNSSLIISLLSDCHIYGHLFSMLWQYFYGNLLLTSRQLKCFGHKTITWNGILWLLSCHWRTAGFLTLPLVLLALTSLHFFEEVVHFANISIVYIMECIAAKFSDSNKCVFSSLGTWLPLWHKGMGPRCRNPDKDSSANEDIAFYCSKKLVRRLEGLE